MSAIRDLYRTRLITNNTRTKTSSGAPLTINYKVDLVVALNNVPSSPDYDEEVIMQTGTKFSVEYHTPEKFNNIVFFSFKEQVESFLKELDNPDSDIYVQTS